VSPGGIGRTDGEPSADRDAIAATLRGERERFGELVDRHRGALVGMLSHHCRSAGEIDEVVQEAFVSCFRALAGFDAQRPFLPWLMAIARNELLMRIRKRRRSST
jgi:RNA polymerase sigma factor (sigma-70 family)